MRQIEFAKMVASGNDFAVVDAIKVTAPHFSGSKLNEFARQACDRKFGVGADGLIILEKSKKANFKMRIFNPDGSEPNMCGNGARCAALLFHNKGSKAKAGRPMTFETKAGLLSAEVKGALVKVRMPDPKDVWTNIDLNIGNQFYKVHYINTGVPHAVLFVANVDTINVKEAGRQMRSHKHFQPEGTNADFAQVLDSKTLKVRTYERGVEDETLACGTGSVASALLSFYLKLTKKGPLTVQTRSGEELRIYFEFDKNKFTDVWLEGAAKIVYEGKYNI